MAEYKRAAWEILNRARAASRNSGKISLLQRHDKADNKKCAWSATRRVLQVGEALACTLCFSLLSDGCSGRRHRESHFFERQPCRHLQHFCSVTTAISTTNTIHHDAIALPLVCPAPPTCASCHCCRFPILSRSLPLNPAQPLVCRSSFEDRAYSFVSLAACVALFPTTPAAQEPRSRPSRLSRPYTSSIAPARHRTPSNGRNHLPRWTVHLTT